MNLTWHIAKKDLRRIGLPAGALVGFVLVAAIWFSRAHLSVETVAAHDEMSWVNGISAVATWTVGMLVVMSLLLAGHLVLEDPVLGTTTFWQTRPIGRGRLLAAKVIAGLLALVAAPTLALMPVWLANGFSFGELARAATGFAAWQMLFVLVAFLFASLSRSIAQFFFSTLATAVVFALAVARPPVSWWGTELGADVEMTRRFLAVVLPLPIAAFVVVHQFLTRRTRLGWSMIVAGIVAIHLVRVYWPRDLTPYFQSKSWPAATGDDRRGAIVLDKIALPLDRSQPAAVVVRVEAGSDGSFLAPHSGAGQLRWLNGRIASLSLKPGPQWGVNAAQRLAGVTRGEGTIEWDMVTGADAEKIPVSFAPPGFAGNVGLVRLRGQVVAEVPLRAGAEARRGSSGLCVVAIKEGSGTERPSVVVEERDVWFRRESGPATVGGMIRTPDDVRQDCYLLVNRAMGTVQSPRIIQQGAAELSKLRVRVRQLEFSYPEPFAGWRDGAMLIKVRFEEERRLTRELATERVTLISEEPTK